MAGFGPYHFFNDICNKKANLLENDPSAEKDFVPFIVMRALSFNIDCILVVERLNQFPNMSKVSLYNSLLQRIRRKNRKWVYEKVTPITPDLEIIMKHYGYSYEKAVSAQKLLSTEYVQSLHTLYDEGGRGNTRRKRK